MNWDVNPTLLNAPPRTLTDAVGLPLQAYRREHVHGCVVRSLRREQVSDLQALVAAVDGDQNVRARLRRSVAVAGSGLFRDPNQLRLVDRHVMPSVVSGAKRVRVWSAGCGGGEEAYTLATMLEWNGVLSRSEIVGSDILEELVAEAAAGVVGGARTPAGLRGRVQWDVRDLTTAGPPEGEFDLVLCRDLLTYLTPVACEAVERTLAAALSVGGVIVVGRNERLENADALGLSRITPSAYRRLS
jgi:chemotaxis protein methyltransferase CheR